MKLFELFGRRNDEHWYSKNGVGLKGVGVGNGSLVKYTLEDGRIAKFKIIKGKDENGFPLTREQIQAATEYYQNNLHELEQAIRNASPFDRLGQ